MLKSAFLEALARFSTPPTAFSVRVSDPAIFFFASTTPGTCGWFLEASIICENYSLLICYSLLFICVLDPYPPLPGGPRNRSGHDLLDVALEGCLEGVGLLLEPRREIKCRLQPGRKPNIFAAGQFLFGAFLTGIRSYKVYQFLKI